MNFVFSSQPLLTLPAEPFFYFRDLSEIGRGGAGAGGGGDFKFGFGNEVTHPCNGSEIF